MKLSRIVGFGSGKILARDCHVRGTVTKVHRCWWLSVKYDTRPALYGRRALHPHIITFTYAVAGIPYEGRLWIGTRCRAPEVGTEIEVYYDPEKPRDYACYAFGPALL